MFGLLQTRDKVVEIELIFYDFSFAADSASLRNLLQFIQKSFMIYVITAQNAILINTVYIYNSLDIYEKKFHYQVVVTMQKIVKVYRMQKIIKALIEDQLK